MSGLRPMSTSRDAATCQVEAVSLVLGDRHVDSASRSIRFFVRDDDALVLRGDRRRDDAFAVDDGHRLVHHAAHRVREEHAPSLGRVHRVRDEDVVPDRGHGGRRAVASGCAHVGRVHGERFRPVTRRHGARHEQRRGAVLSHAPPRGVDMRRSLHAPYRTRAQHGVVGGIAAGAGAAATTLECPAESTLRRPSVSLPASSMGSFHSMGAWSQPTTAAASAAAQTSRAP